ncbi:MAG: hypothetical protein JWP27_2626 [Flaviaesturariibacter sp.]|nr:hypothetical protein [Flaviaesturariibacter sp.]
MKNNEKENEKPAARQRAKLDFWDAVAADVASGYGAAEEDLRRRDSKLNEDQLPDDHERGDA